MITLFTGYDEEPKKKDEQAAEEEQAQKSGVPTGFFSRMRDAVTRTRETFSSRINEIVALTRDAGANDQPLGAVAVCDDALGAIQHPAARGRFGCR